MKCQKLVDLTITHSSLRLKYLEVNDCLLLRRVMIYAVNLVAFLYTGPMIVFLFENVPKLQIIATGIKGITDSIFHLLTGLANDVPQLKDLSLWLHVKAGFILERLPLFANLKKLHIATAPKEDDLHWIIALLKSCPLLTYFQLHLLSVQAYEKEPKEIRKPQKCPHDHLKNVVIRGFCGSQNEIEFATYVLQNATSLETMLIHLQACCYQDGKSNHREAGEGTSATITADRIFEQLQAEAPPHVKIMVL
ncbi:uncharacterized protein LOC122671988 [Telopea speciosissima]|uniref:uncharacterized protein LOC122671988 n=1 Tax=Telopea speciosissima TaxID=54955 RepID=UPI001CC68BFD|nr:uncharacterized protein LOC122671988 [Telopea speciosissima]